MGQAVDVQEFARVFVKTAAELPTSGDNRWDPESERYYFRLDFTRLEKAEVPVSDVLKRLRERYDVEVIHRVDGPQMAKERRYVESPDDVPDDYKVEEGAQGGIYYETDPTNRGVGSPNGSEHEVGYDGQPVYAILADNVTEGDEVAFERDDGTRDVGKITEVGTEEVRVETGDGSLTVQPAPFDTDPVEKGDPMTNGHDLDPGTGRGTCASTGETIEAETMGDLTEDCPHCGDALSMLGKEGDGGGDGGGDGMTTSTEGVHNTRYSPDEDDEEKEEDLGVVGDLGKAFESDVYRVKPPEDSEDDFSGDVLGVAVDFPNHDVYVDWHNEVFPDQLDNAHVSIYGSIADLEQATGNRVELVDAVDVDEVEKSFRKADGGTWVSYVGPEGGQGWLNLQTCEVRYQAERPGPGMEGYDEEPMREGWETFDDDPATLPEGSIIEFTQGDEEPQVGLVDMNHWQDTGKIHIESMGVDPDWMSTYISADNPDLWDISAYQPDATEEPEVEDEQEEYVGVLADDKTSNDPDDKGDWVVEEGIFIGDTITFDTSHGKDEAEVIGWQTVEGVGEPGDPVILGEDIDVVDIPAHTISVNQGNFEGLANEYDEDSDILGDIEDEIDDTQVAPDPEPEADPSDWTTHVGDYDVAAFDEADFEDWGTLSDFGFPSGVSGQHMDVGALPGYDGDNKDLVFRRKFGDDALKPETGFRQMVSYTIGTALGGQMPQHAGHATEDGYVVAQGVEGHDIGKAPKDVLDAVDEETFYEQAAVQIILGNNDAHMQNVKVTPDGDVVFHDIDHSAGDIAGDFVGQKSYYDNAIDRVLGELYRSAKYVSDEDEATVKQNMLDAAEALAKNHAQTGASSDDGDFDTFAECVTENTGEADDAEALCASIFFGGTGDDELAQALQEAVGHSPEFTQNVQNNIQNLAAGNIAW